jgi:hypothetical protein
VAAVAEGLAVAVVVVDPSMAADMRLDTSMAVDTIMVGVAIDRAAITRPTSGWM